jgi:hypothetical protein
MSTTPSFFDRELPETLDRPGYFRLAAAVIIGWLIFWWGSVFIGLPPVPYLSGSLITLASPAAALGAAAAGLFICTVIGKFVVGDLKLGQDVQFEGGLVAAPSRASFSCSPANLCFFTSPSSSAGSAFA